MTEIPGELEANGWVCDDDRRAMSKSYKFADFRSAIAWMVRAAFEAEAINHHPEWRNVYNRVDVRLTTHDTGGLTERDFDLARRIDKLGN